MSKYEFKYRLSQKSSLATIAKAVRALGLSMSIEKRGGWSFSWFEEDPATGKEIYKNRIVLDENVAEWLNLELEAHELLAPEEPNL